MKNKILFMGRKDIAAECLQWLCNQPHVEIVGVLTDSHLDVSPTTQVAMENNLKLYSFESALEELGNGSLYYDIGFSVLYWRKLRGHFLSVPKKGVINFHPAPLPEYKGTAGYNLAILESRNSWACSAHFVDADIDTGEIIKVDWFPICSEVETAQTLETKSKDCLRRLFFDVSKRILDGELLQTYPNIGGKYTSRAEMEAMKKIVDGDDIERKIRAFWFPPYTGAYIEVEGKKYTLVSQEILTKLAPKGISSLFSCPRK